MAQHTQEIERKWLVRDLPDLGTLNREQIIQGYLAVTSDGTEVRIRRKGKACFETVKRQGGLRRDEIEVEISHDSSEYSGLRRKGGDSKRHDTRCNGTAINLSSMCIKERSPGWSLLNLSSNPLKRANGFLHPPGWERK